MIKKVVIKNFQSHYDAEVVFCEGVNVFTGASDSGKSAIMRAIRWVFQNTPQGDDFISHGTKKTEVTVVLNDCVVRRVRSSSENLYYLDGTEFKAFGNEVPAEIVAALNTDELSWQSQLDSPFLLSSTSGEAARYLNRVSNLSIIDDCLAFASKRKKETVQQIHFIEKENAQKRLDIEALGDISSLESRIKRIEKIEEKAIEAKKAITMLNRLIEEGHRIQHEIWLNTPPDTLEEHLDNAIAYFKEFDALQKECEGMSRLALRLHKIETDLRLLYCVPPMSSLDKANALVKEKKELEQQIRNLQKILSEIKRCTDEMKEVGSAIIRLKKLFDDEMPEVCALCGAKR